MLKSYIYSIIKALLYIILVLGLALADMMAAVDVMTRRRRRKRPNVAVINIQKQGRVCRVPAPIHVTTAVTHDTGGNASAIGDGELDHGLELLGSE